MFKRFHHNAKGIASVEFALLVPILLALYLGSIEVSSVLSTSKRNARVASTVADLVTQQETVSKSDVNAILNIGSAIMYPYTTTKPRIMVVGVSIDSSFPRGGKIIWSRGMANGAFNGGFGTGYNTDYTVPSKLIADGTFLINVTSEVDFQPLVTFMENGGRKITSFPLENSYWLRPRESETITCSDC